MLPSRVVAAFPLHTNPESLVVANVYNARSTLGRAFFLPRPSGGRFAGTPKMRPRSKPHRPPAAAVGVGWVAARAAESSWPSVGRRLASSRLLLRLPWFGLGVAETLCLSLGRVHHAAVVTPAMTTERNLRVRAIRRRPHEQLAAVLLASGRYSRGNVWRVHGLVLGRNTWPGGYAWLGSGLNPQRPQVARSPASR